MSTIEIKSNVTETLKHLDDFAYSQVPFATALTLTRLAQKSQADLRGTLQRYFTIRTPWVEKGVVYQGAKKSDWPNMESEVGSRDYFMSLQVLGGLKKPKGNNLSIPQAIRNTPADKIPRAARPARLLASKKKPRPFIQKLKNGTRAILQRTRGGRYPVKVLYIFKPSANLQKRWPLSERVETYVRANYDKEFGRSLGEAMAKGKKR